MVIFNVSAPATGIVTDFDACLGAPRCLEYAEGLSQTNGDSAILLSPDAVAIDMVAWPMGGIGNAANTLCRLPDGSGPFMQCASTLGSTNQAASDAGMGDAGMDADMDGGMEGGTDGSTPTAVVVVNEVQSTGQGGGPDWYEIVNLGCSNPVENLRFVQILEQLLERKAKIVETPAPPSEPIVTYAEVTKARRLLGYEPRVQVEEGLKRFVAWMRAERLI